MVLFSHKTQINFYLTQAFALPSAKASFADYNNKAQKLLEDRGTYREIKTDPTYKLKNKLGSLLKKIKAEGGISDNCIRRCIPQGL